MFMWTAFIWLLPEALKENELDNHRIFQIEISQSYLLRVIPIRFSWVNHTLFQTSLFVFLKLLPQMFMNLAISDNYGLVKLVIILGTFGIQKYSYQWRTCNPTTVR